MKKKLCLVSLTLLCLATVAGAQNNAEITLEPVVVTATRIEVPIEEVGKTTTIVTAAQLEEQKAVSLAEALQNVPGLLVRQQRGPGGLVSFKIRGLDSEYTQILVDGLPLRDPSDPQGAAGEFMSDMLIENIERIEIVRGSSSTLYGSDSVGGTINIISKKGTETPELFLRFEGGSLSTFQEAAGIRGIAGKMNYAFSGKRADSEGVDDHDEFSETVFAGRIGIDVTQDVSLTAQMKYSDSEVDLNNSPEIASGLLLKDQDDPDDNKQKTLLSGGVALSHQLLESLDYSVKVGYVDVERDLSFGPQGNEFGYGSETTYSGNILNAEAQANYSLNDANLLTFGMEYEAEEFEQKLGERTDSPDATRQAVYAQDSMTFFDEQFSLVPGIRYMDHDQAGDRFDWEVSASLLFGETGRRLHGHVGTGFRAPSLYELYGASVFGSDLYEFGNKDLNPEESLGWDIGFEIVTLDDKARLDVTYFSNDFDEIIGFGTVGYENVAGGESKGLEVETRYALSENVSVRGTYTYTETEDSNGEKFYGVPEQEFGLNLNYRFWQRFNANVALTVRSEEDIPLFDSSTFLSERYENDGYTTVDLALKYRVNESWNVWTRVENLFDEDYNVGGYDAPGIGVYGGIHISL